MIQNIYNERAVMALYSSPELCNVICHAYHKTFYLTNKHALKLSRTGSSTDHYYQIIWKLARYFRRRILQFSINHIWQNSLIPADGFLTNQNGFLDLLKVTLRNISTKLFENRPTVFFSLGCNGNQNYAWIKQIWRNFGEDIERCFVWNFISIDPLVKEKISWSTDAGRKTQDIGRSR